MKKKLLQTLLLVVILMMGSVSARAQHKHAFIGYWSWECPDAPPGANGGNIIISRDSLIVIYNGESTRYPAEWFKIKNDSLIFFHNNSLVNVLCALKRVNKTTATGSASWEMDEAPMTMTKISSRPKVPKRK